MREMPEEEARKLLGQTLRCDDVGCWKIVAANAHKCRTGSGLTDEHGAGTGLTVELQFRMDLRRKCRSYVFSVFKRNRYGVDRVYQLDVNQTPDLPQDDHSRPHEHLGHRRYMGPDEWIAWNYDELLRYFCTRTNIRFRLLPLDPAEILGGEMINKNLFELFGFACHHLEDDGRLAVIDTPFVFEDGDSIPVYVEEVRGRLRVFDNGEVVWHLMGRGVKFDEPVDADFIKTIVAARGALLNHEGEVEVWADPEQGRAAFGCYISAIFGVVEWERCQVALANERRQFERTAGIDSATTLSA